MHEGILSWRYGRVSGIRHTPESADQIVNRVAAALAGAEWGYGAGQRHVGKIAAAFEDLMRSNRFWPAGRILNNAGSRQGQLASCFVLPLPDDFQEIFDTVRVAANCHRTGGGTGFDLSALRPYGAPVASSEAGGASGPVPWLTLLDAETFAVMAGGKMRGANMGSLSVYHPDALKFVQAKSSVGALPNFNLSIAVDNPFMQRIEEGHRPEIWEAIVNQAWKTGDPGLLFIDAINNNNCLYDSDGPITTTNPCGEQPMYPFEASNLGSINLAEFWDRDKFRWTELHDTVRLAVRLLDNAIDVSIYPDARISGMAYRNRRLGLGVMGFADLLVSAGIQYDSTEAMAISDEIGSQLAFAAREASSDLANERGSFPSFERSSLTRPARNCAVTSIAPTGTISLVAECSSGIEPRFASIFTKHVIEEAGIVSTDRELMAAVQKYRGVSRKSAFEIIQSNTVSHMGLPQPIAKVFRYAHDVSPLWHVDVAAAWQRHIDNGVSKTVNMSRFASPTDVSNVLIRAWARSCKGVSIYREGCREQDLLESATRSTRSQSKELANAVRRRT